MGTAKEPNGLRAERKSFYTSLAKVTKLKAKKVLTLVTGGMVSVISRNILKNYLQQVLSDGEVIHDNIQRRNIDSIENLITDYRNLSSVIRMIYIKESFIYLVTFPYIQSLG